MAHIGLPKPVITQQAQRGLLALGRQFDHAIRLYQELPPPQTAKRQPRQRTPNGRGRYQFGGPQSSVPSLFFFAPHQREQYVILRHLQRQPHALIDPRQHTLIRRKKQGKEEYPTDDHHHSTGDRAIPEAGQKVTRHGRDDPKEHGQPYYRDEPVAPQVSGGPRHNQHGHDQDRAHGLKRRHRRQRDQTHQEIVHQRGIDSHRHGQGWVECGNFEFFIKKRDHRQINRQHRAQYPHRPRPQRLVSPQQQIPRGIGDLAVEHALLIEIHLTGIRGDDHHAQREKRGKHNADGRVLLYAPAPVKCLDQQRG